METLFVIACIGLALAFVVATYVTASVALYAYRYLSR